MKRLSRLSIMFTTLLLSTCLLAAPGKKYWNQWIAFDPLSEQQINYPVWKSFLEKYTTQKKAQVYVKYKSVTNKDKSQLSKAIEQLTQKDISHYNRDEQLAYWINLYNMETVYLILQHYPVASITDISFSYFGYGPWDKKLLNVNDTDISLNDIEHRIIRPIWNDPRIHAAVNCASISCPNLNTEPYTGSDIDEQLNQAFKAFVNSKKGVQISGNRLILSKIFDWYGQDFGDTSQEMKAFISYYAQTKVIANEILKTNKVVYKKYNWDLNESDQ